MGVASIERAERSHAPLWRVPDFYLKELSLRQSTWNLQTLEHRFIYLTSMQNEINASRVTLSKSAPNLSEVEQNAAALLIT